MVAALIVSNKKVPFDRLYVHSSGFILKTNPSSMIVSSFKVVGCTFDSKLTWGDMIMDEVKKARCRVGAIRRLRKFLSTKNLKLMYTAFIRPILEYGSLLYCSASSSHLSKLDQAQAETMKSAMGDIQLPPGMKMPF